MLEFRSLAGVSLEVIADAFDDAFSRYDVPIQMTPAKLDLMMRERSVRLDHSFGLFDQGVLAGFVLNGSRICDNRLTAYDSGTGVRTAYQSSGHGATLLKQTIDKLRTMGYRHYVLEVLTKNTPAILLYKRNGFEITRELNCYSLPRETFRPDGGTVSVSAIGEDWRDRISDLMQYQPSWQNSHRSVSAISDMCRLVEVVRGGRTVAFAVIVPDTGNLMQIGWRHDEYVAPLLGRCSELTTADQLKVINVPSSESTIHQVLTSSGFRHFVTQYEMVKAM